MSTRLYLSSTSASFTPQLQTIYTKQDNAVYRTLTRTKGATAFEQPQTFNAGGTTAAGDDFLLGVFRWELGAQTITGTVDGVIRMREEYGSGLYLASTTLSVQSADFSTVRGVLRVQTSGDAPGTETLGLENTRVFNAHALTSVTAQNGDWLVLECALINPTGIGGTRYVQMEFGENAADLAFNSTSITQGAPWLEFSQTLLAKDEVPTESNTYRGIKSLDTLTLGSTSVTTYVQLENTDGTPATGLTFGTAGLSINYFRTDTGSMPIAPVTQTASGAWVAGGFVEVSSVTAPGLYRLDLLNGVAAAGATQVGLSIKGTGLKPYSAAVWLVPERKVFATVGSSPSRYLIRLTGPTVGAGQLLRRQLQVLGGAAANERVTIVDCAANGDVVLSPPLSVVPTVGDRVVVL